MIPALFLAAVLAGPQTVSAPPADAHAFILTGSGRFAVFADRATIARDGDLSMMRAFQVAEPSFTAGGESYWGGWSNWVFNCATMTADRLDFTAVREGGDEGPTTTDDQPAYKADPGGDAAELLRVACYHSVTEPDAVTLQHAVTKGRAALAADQGQ